MQNKKRFILLAILIVGCGTILFAVKEYNRKPISVQQLDADFTLAATDLIREFNENQAAANQKFLGKTLQVTGVVRTIEGEAGKNMTVVLGEQGGNIAIRGSLDSTELIPVNASISNKQTVMKGICTGYIPDDMGLGADIVLNKCIINEKK